MLIVDLISINNIVVLIMYIVCYKLKLLACYYVVARNGWGDLDRIKGVIKTQYYKVIFF